MPRKLLESLGTSLWREGGFLDQTIPPALTSASNSICAAPAGVACKQPHFVFVLYGTALYSTVQC